MDGRSVFVSCIVKASMSEKWIIIPMGNGKNRDQPSFLLSILDLRETTPEDLSCPSDFDDVTVRLQSEDTRIQNPIKLQELLSLRDDVYKTKKVNFHCNLVSFVEIIGKRRNRDPENDHRDDEDETIKAATWRSVSTPRSTFDYDLRSFVTVRAGDNADPLSFLVWNVVEVHRGKQSVAQEITVHWFEFYSGDKQQTGKYRSLFVNSDKGRLSCTYCIDVDCMLVSFEGMTPSCMLLSMIARHLREKQH